MTPSFPSPFEEPEVCMLETRLVTRAARVPVQVQSGRDVALIVRDIIGQADREHFVALFLNSRHVVTHAHIVSRGTTQTAPVHPREVFKGAILANASAVVVAHNHPSGDVKPSADDERVTERLRQAGELLGIELLDSLVVGPVNLFHSSAEGSVLSVSYENAREVADGPR